MYRSRHARPPRPHSRVALHLRGRRISTAARCRRAVPEHPAAAGAGARRQAVAAAALGPVRPAPRHRRQRRHGGGARLRRRREPPAAAGPGRSRARTSCPAAAPTAGRTASATAPASPASSPPSRSTGVEFRGVAPGAQILPLRVSEQLGGQENRQRPQGRLPDVAAAIRYAVSKKASVINLSLSYATPRPSDLAVREAIRVRDRPRRRRGRGGRQRQGEGQPDALSRPPGTTCSASAPSTRPGSGCRPPRPAVRRPGRPR